jgi:hypothetical protein
MLTRSPGKAPPTRNDEHAVDQQVQIRVSAKRLDEMRPDHLGSSQVVLSVMYPKITSSECGTISASLRIPVK